MDRIFVAIASVIMLLGVATGAFGAHGLSGYFEQHSDLESSFDTALRYLFIHGLALFAVAWAATRWPGTFINLAGYLFIAGIVIFSGSLFLLSLTGIRWLGAITPIGGVAFLAGWLVLFISAWRGS
jgi:uncharacterized membrane protein YgdD (TMEM256/DUF423 family)